MAAMSDRLQQGLSSDEFIAPGVWCDSVCLAAEKPGGIYKQWTDADLSLDRYVGELSCLVEQNDVPSSQVNSCASQSTSPRSSFAHCRTGAGPFATEDHKCSGGDLESETTGSRSQLRCSLYDNHALHFGITRCCVRLAQSRSQILPSRVSTLSFYLNAVNDPGKKQSGAVEPKLDTKPKRWKNRTPKQHYDNILAQRRYRRVGGVAICWPLLNSSTALLLGSVKLAVHCGSSDYPVPASAAFLLLRQRKKAKFEGMAEQAQELTTRIKQLEARSLEADQLERINREYEQQLWSQQAEIRQVQQQLADRANLCQAAHASRRQTESAGYSTQYQLEQGALTVSMAFHSRRKGTAILAYDVCVHKC